MKKTDIAMLVLIASVSVIVAFFVGQAIFKDPGTGTATVNTIEKIEPGIVMPNTDIFNKDAINPSVRVQISGNN